MTLTGRSLAATAVSFPWTPPGWDLDQDLDRDNALAEALMRDRVTSEATSAPEAITDARDKALLLATLALDPNAILLRGQPIATLEGGHTGPVLAVAFSPDGQLASAVGDRRTTRPRARVKQQNFHSSRAAREY